MARSVQFPKTRIKDGPYLCKKNPTVSLLLQMSGKRTRSYRCAVHQRDREVSSENDFHLLLEDPTLFARYELFL